MKNHDNNRSSSYVTSCAAEIFSTKSQAKQLIEKDISYEDKQSRSPRGRGVLPYTGLVGTGGQPGHVFRDFCLNQGIDFISFCLKKGIFFLDDKQPARMFYELNYSQIFKRSFGLNVLKRVSKIGILSLTG